jgi:hypothetical protein
LGTSALQPWLVGLRGNFLGHTPLEELCAKWDAGKVNSGMDETRMIFS